MIEIYIYNHFKQKASVKNKFKRFNRNKNS